ncbi:MAG: HlyD family efflux transporter periplasmic adaptor subunit [Hyphomicrobiaceae bacterium]
MAVKVRREKADQRRHHRVTAPLYVVADGIRVRTSDWSLGGLRVQSFPGRIPAVGEIIPLSLCLPFQGFDVSFDCKGQVLRSDPAHSSFAVVFHDLGERERELMQHFIEELVRGSMSDVEDTIQRIDVPVTPASLEPDPIPFQDVPVRRFPIRTAAMTTLYLALGLLVFGYAGVIAYTQFFRMQVETAVIAAPVEIVAAQGEGRVEWTGAKPGDHVNKGEVVLRITDNALEREIELANIAIRQKTAELAFYKHRQIDELERLKGYATLEMKTTEQLKLEIESLAAQTAAADNLRDRLAELHKNGFTTTSNYEIAVRNAVAVRKQLEAKKVELSSQVSLLKDNMGRRYYNGREMVGDLGQVEARVRLAENQIALAKQQLQTLVQSRERLAVKAPFSGTLLEMPRLDDGTVRKGDTVAVMEKRTPRHVTAFLNQDEIARIGLGDDALIYIPALGETLEGRVKVIDRTSGFIREQDRSQNPGYNWRGPVDRSAKVTLEFKDPSRVDDVERYRSGLPVVVVFPQHTTNQLIDTIRRQIATVL